MKVFVKYDNAYSKISAIKAIRQLTGCGLTEAADMIDYSQQSNQAMEINIVVNPQTLGILKNAGLTVFRNSDSIQALQELAISCLNNMELNLAEKLFKVLVEEKRKMS